MEENWAGCPGRRVFRDSWQTLASLKYLTIVWSPFQLFLFWSFEEWKSGGFHPHSVTSQTRLQRGLHWTWKGCDPKGAVVYWERVRGCAWPGAWQARSSHAAPCCRTIAPVLCVARKQTHGPLSCLGSYSWWLGLPFEPGLTDSPAMVQRRRSPQWAGDVFFSTKFLSTLCHPLKTWGPWWDVNFFPFLPFSCPVPSLVRPNNQV